VFFGFNLENWQFRLLLDGLKLKDENTTLSPRSQMPLSSMTKMFYEERFNFQFIDKDSVEFLGELNNRLSPQGEDSEQVVKQVFLLYHEADEQFKNELENSLSQFIKNGEIELHYPQKFIASTSEEEILEVLKNADIILSLLSPNFLADSKWNEEHLLLPQKAEAILIPIIARPCDWQAHPILASKSALPENGQAITSNHWNTPDDAYFDITQSFKKILKR